MAKELNLTGVERFFDKNDIIVSKTDLKGVMTYTNDVFLDISGYTEAEMIGKPHSVIRNPLMPRCVFKLLWERIQSGKEVFAYVMNRCKNGDHYWVLAHVTPSFDGNGKIVGYHSNRRVPSRDVLDQVIIPLYKKLLEEEKRYGSKKDATEGTYKTLMDIVKSKGMEYDEYIFALQNKIF